MIGCITEYQVLELRLFAPVILVALQHNAVTGNPFNKLVWAGACSLNPGQEGLESNFQLPSCSGKTQSAGSLIKIFHRRGRAQFDDDIRTVIR